MRKYTKVLLLSLLLSCTLLLSSCISSSGSGSFFLCISHQDKTSFSMEYEKFNGYKTYKIDFKQDTILNMSFKTDDGVLSCKITDEKGNVLYDLDNVQSTSDSITLTSSGKYTIYLQASNHSGSFKFSWA